MKQYIDMTMEDLELLPIWRVITIASDGNVQTFRDGINASAADRLVLRLAMQGADCEACPMPEHDHHVLQWEIRQLEGMH